MLKKNYFVLIIFLLSFSFVSCDKDTGETLLYSPDLKMPVVEGLYFTSEGGPDVLAVWGNPSGSNFCYPSIGSSTTILFSVPEQSEVSVWVVPARLSSQSSEDVIKSFNRYFYNASGLAVAILMDKQTKPAGTYAINFDFKDSEENLLPEGFYRIYLESKNQFKWCDVLNFRNESNLYIEIVNIINEQKNIIWRPY